jgi:hypothetical protein
MCTSPAATSGRPVFRGERAQRGEALVVVRRQVRS